MTPEREQQVMSGWVMLPLIILLWLVIPALIGFMIIQSVASAGLIVFLVLLGPFAILMTIGFFTLQPNEAQVLVLFGKYVGTVREEGFHWANPFSVHHGSIAIEASPDTPGKQQWVSRPNGYRISLRARNFETQTLKVNDLRGNPIDIGAVVVWYVRNTAQAMFDVDDYRNYVRVQSETAVRHLANCYPYDHGGNDTGDEITLRDGTEAISNALQQELQARLDKAGVVVEEARLTHLAYSTEIAGAMLRRQQAEAIIAARQKIVQGAVSMVEMALEELSNRHVLEFDDERKAAMVSNLLVVLCGDRDVEPVINTGTLYH